MAVIEKQCCKWVCCCIFLWFHWLFWGGNRWPIRLDLRVFVFSINSRRWAEYMNEVHLYTVWLHSRITLRTRGGVHRNSCFLVDFSSVNYCLSTRVSPHRLVRWAAPLRVTSVSALKCQRCCAFPSRFCRTAHPGPEYKTDPANPPVSSSRPEREESKTFMCVLEEHAGK